MGLIDKTAVPFWTHAVRPQGEERSDESAERDNVARQTHAVRPQGEERSDESNQVYRRP